MKAAVLEDLDRIVVKEIPTPRPEDNGILVKVKSCAVCGSDLRIYHHGNDRVTPPHVIGHEVAGEVVEVGRSVTKFRVGDRVAIGADIPCGECSFCEAGFSNNCGVNYAIGYQFPGGFAEYMPLNKTVVDYGPVHRLAEHVSFDEGALAEPLACVLNGLELSDIRLGQTVVVIGAGPIGCMITEVARHMGATKIIVVEHLSARLEQAQKLGADVCILSSEEDGVKRVIEETGGLGADVVIVACPSPEAQVDALSMAKSRGRVSFFGGLPKSRSMVTLDTNVIHYKEIFVCGAHGSTPAQHRRAVGLIASGTINAGRYISHRFTLQEIHRAFETAERREGLRVIVNP